MREDGVAVGVGVWGHIYVVSGRAVQHTTITNTPGSFMASAYFRLKYKCHGGEVCCGSCVASPHCYRGKWVE